VRWECTCDGRDYDDEVCKLFALEDPAATVAYVIREIVVCPILFILFSFTYFFLNQPFLCSFPK
jgi:hypothetical protein